jgi:hypothetical protein
MSLNFFFFLVSSYSVKQKINLRILPLSHLAPVSPTKLENQLAALKLKTKSIQDSETSSVAVAEAYNRHRSPSGVRDRRAEFDPGVRAVIDTTNSWPANKETLRPPLKITKIDQPNDNHSETQEITFHAEIIITIPITRLEIRIHLTINLVFLSIYIF